MCSLSLRDALATSPALSCAASVTVECGQPIAFIPPTANDICDGTNVTIQIVSTVTNTTGFCGKTFTATRTWRTTDSRTNRPTSSQSIVVVDTTPPALSCAASVTVECAQPIAF